MHDQVRLTPRGLDQRGFTLIDGGLPRPGVAHPSSGGGKAEPLWDPLGPLCIH